MRRPLLALAALGAVLAGILYARRTQRPGLEAPAEPPAPAEPASPDALLAALDPKPKERVLEIGPGDGEHTLAVAERLGSGKLDAYDRSQESLDAIVERARERGLKNVTGWHGEAGDLLFEENRFDAAYAGAVEDLPDLDAALGELARVVKPGGRVVLGASGSGVELGELQAKAAGAGLDLERREDAAPGYVAVFAVPPAA